MEKDHQDQMQQQNPPSSDSSRAAPALTNISSRSDPKQEQKEADLRQDESKDQAGKQGEKKKSFLDKLPDWVSSNLRNPRSIKTLIRCCE